jgi:hypothetical protein
MSWGVGTVIVAVVLAVLPQLTFYSKVSCRRMNPGNHFSGSGCLQNLSYRLYWPVSTLSGLV